MMYALGGDSYSQVDIGLGSQGEGREYTRKAMVVVPGRRQDVRTSSNRVGHTGRSAREVTTVDLNGKSPEIYQSLSQSQRITEQEAPVQLNEEKRRGLKNRVRLAVKSMLGNSAKVTKRSRHTKEM